MSSTREVRSLIDSGEKKAADLLRRNRGPLEETVNRLGAQETPRKDPTWSGAARHGRVGRLLDNVAAYLVTRETLEGPQYGQMP